MQTLYNYETSVTFILYEVTTRLLILLFPNRDHIIHFMHCFMGLDYAIYEYYYSAHCLLALIS